MVHGVGRHSSGYSGRLQNNLTLALKLGVTDEPVKRIHIRSPQPDSKPLGVIQIYRHLNKAGTRDANFHELTWSEISEPDDEQQGA